MSNIIKQISTFLGLTDTPTTYVGQAEKAAIVNLAENKIVFADRARIDGNASQAFNVKDATSLSHAVTKAQLDVVTGGLNYRGVWTPNITSYPDEALTASESGYFWICDAAGTDKDGRTWNAGDWIIYNGGDSTDELGWDVYAPASSSTFIGLTDTPADYTGHAGKVPAVNVGESGLEFTAVKRTAVASWFINSDTLVFAGAGGIIDFPTALGTFFTSDAALITQNNGGFTFPVAGSIIFTMSGWHTDERKMGVEINGVQNMQTGNSSAGSVGGYDTIQGAGTVGINQTAQLVNPGTGGTYWARISFNVTFVES